MNQCAGSNAAPIYSIENLYVKEFIEQTSVRDISLGIVAVAPGQPSFDRIMQTKCEVCCHVEDCITTNELTVCYLRTDENKGRGRRAHISDLYYSYRRYAYTYPYQHLVYESTRWILCLWLVSDGILISFEMIFQDEKSAVGDI